MIIKTENLSYIYMKGSPFEKEALKDINIGIEKGEFVGLIGHTGSGKSTLIQHFNCLLKPTKGKIYIDGVDVTDKGIGLREIRQKVGLVFQYPEHQLFEETVYKDIAFGPINMGLSVDEIDSRVKEAISVVGLKEDHLSKSPFELSGGQKRRVAIACVLALKPKVLVLDEPTAGLDPKGRNEILDQIQNLYKKQGLTIILVSHSMEEIAEHVNRIIVMNKGSVSMDDIPSNIFKNTDELEKMGLSSPQITYLMNKLRERGIEVRNDIYTLTPAIQELKRILGEYRK
jgi:energy-coupling factor transport system ATP-binding protein